MAHFYSRTLSRHALEFYTMVTDPRTLSTCHAVRTYSNRVRCATRRQRGLCIRRRGARGTSCRAAREEVLRGISLQLHFTAFVLAREGEVGPNRNQRRRRCKRERFKKTLDTRRTL